MVEETMQYKMFRTDRRYRRLYGNDERKWTRNIKANYDHDMLVILKTQDRVRQDCMIDEGMAKMYYGEAVVDATRYRKMYKVSDLEATQTWMRE